MSNFKDPEKRIPRWWISRLHARFGSKRRFTTAEAVQLYLAKMRLGNGHLRKAARFADVYPVIDARNALECAVQCKWLKRVKRGWYQFTGLF